MARNFKGFGPALNPRGYKPSLRNSCKFKNLSNMATEQHQLQHCLLCLWNHGAWEKKPDYTDCLKIRFTTCECIPRKTLFIFISSDVASFYYSFTNL